MGQLRVCARAMAEEALHATRASVPGAAGAEPAAGTLTLTPTAVTWQPDDPAAAQARQLAVAQITGVQQKACNPGATLLCLV